MFDVITIGSATVDAFAYTETSELIKIQDSNSEQEFLAYKVGDKVIINELDFMIGGGGTNTAVSFSRLGFKTAYLGKLGADENGTKILNLLNKENIQFIGAREGQTGYSIILDSFQKDRTILTYKGVNNELREADVLLSNLQTKWLYASSMIGKSFETLKSIIKVVKKTGAKIAFNPSSYQAKRGLSELGEILTNVDVLILNKDEAQLLINDKEDNTINLIRKLSKLGPEYIVITDGKNGVVATHEGKIYSATPSQNIKVVECTGAGDAFASGFVAGLILEKDISYSLKLGMIQSENVIVKLGAKSDLIFKQDIENKMNEFKGEIKLIDTHDFNSYKAPEGKEFILSNGEKLYSIQDLALKLKFMPDEVFNFHNSGNHFIDWLNNVFNLEKHTNKLQNIKSKFEMSDIILDCLKNQECDTNEN
ncbi:MAG: carbohydrate kinase family protein [Candidatus Woesearchaeota archaeon]